MTENSGREPHWTNMDISQRAGVRASVLLHLTMPLLMHDEFKEREVERHPPSGEKALGDTTGKF